MKKLSNNFCSTIVAVASLCLKDHCQLWLAMVVEMRPLSCKPLNEKHTQCKTHFQIYMLTSLLSFRHYSALHFVTSNFFSSIWFMGGVPSPRMWIVHLEREFLRCTFCLFFHKSPPPSNILDLLMQHFWTDKTQRIEDNTAAAEGSVRQGKRSSNI